MERIDSQRLKEHYSRFLSSDRLLLTGHSHQAWPNVAAQGVQQAFEDAAKHADDKWGLAEEAANAVRVAVAERIGANADEIALASNTHELLTRFLSALDYKQRPHIVTTAGEFHSLHRQLSRLQEEGIEVSFVDVKPLETLSTRLMDQVRKDTAALMVSTILFESSSEILNLDAPIARAHEVGAEVMLDAYHHFGVKPFDLHTYGKGPIFVTAGGYKYAQWGEGCCFLRVPPQCTLRPIYTGWFSDFENLDQSRHGGRVTYGRRGADLFAGSTYDPTSHYRARSVIEFFKSQELTLPRLRDLYAHQTSVIIDELEGYDVLSPKDPAVRGAFITVSVSNAGAIVKALRERNIFVDARGPHLRFGPAPYLTDDEIRAGVHAFRTLVPPNA